jgi:hypothetical protein
MRGILLSILSLMILQSCLTPKKIIKIEEKAIQFLAESKPEYDFIFLYKNLSEKLCWPELHHVKNFSLYEDSLKNAGDKNSQKILHNIYLYKKIFDSNHKIDSSDIANATDLNLLSLKALYCDCFKINSDTYLKELENIAGQGEYYTTHSLLHLYWLKKYNCLKKSDLIETEKILVKANKNLIKTGKTKLNDIQIESMALIQANNNAIPFKWLNQIAKNQNDDGGWSPDANLKSSSHTTVLALWTLGEYRRKIQKKYRILK